MNVAEPTIGAVATEWRYRLLALAWAGIVFGVMGPTLDWVEFSNGVEKLNVATALEMRRGGPWLVPTLEGESRVRKPPLTAWITAMAVRPATVEALSSQDPELRAQAQRALAWQVRWPALLAMCLTLLATFELGKTLIDARSGLLAALIAGTTIYFFRYARQGITDIQLTLWVVIANACLAKAVMERRHWGYVAAGGAVGIALMSKGPVALIQTFAPLLFFLAWRRHSLQREESAHKRLSRPPTPASSQSAPTPSETTGGKAAGSFWPVLAGMLLMAAAGLAWFVVIWWRDPGVLGLWRKEVLRTDEVEKATSHFYDYLSLFPLMLPWMIFLIGGLIEIGRRIGASTHSHRGTAARAVYLLCLLLVPILIMSLFRDRKERYLLPMVAPAAVIVAVAVEQFLQGKPLDALGRLGVAAQWAMLLALALFPVVSTLVNVQSLRTIEGDRWYSPAVAAALSAAGIVLLVACKFIEAKREALVVMTALLALSGQLVFYHGYARGREGRSEMKPLADVIWSKHPAATVYNIRGVDGRRKMAPNDISICLNRITPMVATVDDIPKGDAPQIYIELWEKPDRDLEPQPAEGWRYFHKVRRGTGWWMAFIRNGGAN